MKTLWNKHDSVFGNVSENGIGILFGNVFGDNVIVAQETRSSQCYLLIFKTCNSFSKLSASIHFELNRSR